MRDRCTPRFDQLEALAALAQTGTTARAAIRLRITPSAESKRIAALEEAVGCPLVARRGRNLVLTPAGEKLLADVEPHAHAIRERRPPLAWCWSSTPIGVRSCWSGCAAGAPTWGCA